MTHKWGTSLEPEEVVLNAELLGKPCFHQRGILRQVGTAHHATGELLPEPCPLVGARRVEGDAPVVVAMIDLEATAQREMHELVQQIGQAGRLDDERSIS